LPLSNEITVCDDCPGVSVQEFVAAWLKVTGKQLKVSEHLFIS
jgi:hypothetical protein